MLGVRGLAGSNISKAIDLAGGDGNGGTRVGVDVWDVPISDFLPVPGEVIIEQFILKPLFFEEADGTWGSVMITFSDTPSGVSC